MVEFERRISLRASWASSRALICPVRHPLELSA